MKSVAKVAVSMPVATLKSLERVRARLKKTRSGAITEAVERWLAAEGLGDDERRYIEGYLKVPEHTRGNTSLAEATVGEWDPWE